MTENREVKSDVFSMLMENKKYALEVYNAVNKTAYEDPEEIQITTLKRGISLSIRNDASIILGMNLNLYEHQSTYSPNMPLRSLIYFVDILKPLIKDEDIYGRKLINIPTPKFVTFYNGIEKRPEIEVFKLSKAFRNVTESPEIELICTVYNINSGYNNELLNNCKVLGEYMVFIDKIRENEADGYEYPIEEAINWCIDNNILNEFLITRKPEVLKAMIIDMTFERREELIRRDERQEGIQQGIQQGQQQLLIAMVKDGIIDIVSAAKYLDIPETEF